jgi:hypothetical protein
VIIRRVLEVYKSRTSLHNQETSAPLHHFDPRSSSEETKRGEPRAVAVVTKASTESCKGHAEMQSEGVDDDELVLLGLETTVSAGSSASPLKVSNTHTKLGAKPLGKKQTNQQAMASGNGSAACIETVNETTADTAVAAAEAYSSSLMAEQAGGAAGGAPVPLLSAPPKARAASGVKPSLDQPTAAAAPQADASAGNARDDIDDLLFD